MATTAHDYMQLYRNLSIPVIDDAGNATKWQPVDINKYLLVSNKKDPNKKDAPDNYNIATGSSAMNALGSKITDHFRTKKSLKVVVGTSGGSPHELTSTADTWGYSEKAF